MLTQKELVDKVRTSKKFELMQKAFKRMTGLEIWLDYRDADDPRSVDELAGDYYKTLTKDDQLKKRIEISHQSMRDSVHNQSVKYTEGLTGLIHFLVPIHDQDGEEIGYLRCGGIRDTYRGVLKFMNFVQELREDGYDEESIKELENSFKKLPKLHGEDLALAVDWVAARADEIDKSLARLSQLHKQSN